MPSEGGGECLNERFLLAVLCSLRKAGRHGAPPPSPSGAVVLHGGPLRGGLILAVAVMFLIKIGTPPSGAPANRADFTFKWPPTALQRTTALV